MNVCVCVSGCWYVCFIVTHEHMNTHTCWCAHTHVVYLFISLFSKPENSRASARRDARNSTTVRHDFTNKLCPKISKYSRIQSTQPASKVVTFGSCAWFLTHDVQQNTDTSVTCGRMVDVPQVTDAETTLNVSRGIFTEKHMHTCTYRHTGAW